MNKTQVIANIGINHDGEIDRAEELIKHAANSGCDGVAMELYHTERRFSDQNSREFKMYQEAELTQTDIVHCKRLVDRLGLYFVATPYDQEALQFLVDSLGVRHISTPPLNKLNPAFLDIINSYLPILPTMTVYLPTGNCNAATVTEALSHLPDAQNLYILHGTPGSPLGEDQTNMGAIYSLHMLTGHKIGFIDYSNDILTASLASIAGARVIVKNIDFQRHEATIDSITAVRPTTMHDLVRVVESHDSIMGDGKLPQ